MKMFTEEDYKKMFERQKKCGRLAAAELGQKIVDRAQTLAIDCGNVPYKLWEFKTLRYTAQLNFIGLLGEYLNFSLVDTHSPEGGSHGYPILYMGDAEALGMDIIRELNYIDSLHWK